MPIWGFVERHGLSHLAARDMTGQFAPPFRTVNNLENPSPSFGNRATANVDFQLPFDA
jgi:hypothetical protein